MEASAIILAAGEGTRMKSKKPKVAHEVLGKPLIRWVVDAAHQAGMQDVVCVLGHAREQVIPLVEKDTTIVFQEQRLGTGDAVNACREAMAGKTGSVVVLSGDSPLITPSTIESLVRVRESENAAMVVLTMELDAPCSRCCRPIPSATAASCAQQTARSSASWSRKTVRRRRQR